MLVGEVREFHGLEDSVANHRGAEAGAEAEEKHAAAFVTAESLHAGVVDNFYGMAEGFAEIEAHPAAAEIVRLAERMTVDDGAGIAHGDASYFQERVAFLTARTILAAVMEGPEGIFTGSF